MKQLLVFIALIFAIFMFLNNSPSALPDLEHAAVAGFAAPFRYASLLAKEPDAKIKIPLRNLKSKQIADTFGAPRGIERTHQGQDLFAERGTPVYSATEGFIWRVGENNLGGNTIWIVGAGGRIYYYAHLDKYAENLKVGDAVTDDSVIGFVGDTGNAKGTPPHLHFGVYAAGEAINPLPLFE